MQLTPRYGTDPLIVLGGPLGAIAEPTIRQRRRMVDSVASFSDEQWAQESRCEGWSSRDVIVHLDSTNAFWVFSIQSGLAGRPTEFLQTFDPVASPAALVSAAEGVSAAEVLDRFVHSTDTLVELLASLDEDDWSKLAEAPPGHQSVSAVAHHALWDSWIHERDILLPLGEVPPQEPDEVAASLTYAAALSPAFALSLGSCQGGVLAIEATDPDFEFVAEIGGSVRMRPGTGPADLCLSGDAVGLLEALSLRCPLDQPVPESAAWMVNGLATIFDVQPA